MMKLIVFVALLLSVHGAPDSAYTADLEERIDAFAQRVLKNATDYSASVFVGTIATTQDPYVVAAASIKRIIDGPVFLTGGTDTDGLTHVVVVKPSKTPVSDNNAHAIEETIGMTIEHTMTGVRSSTSALQARGARSCITLARKCKCSNACKCTGDSRTWICSCTKTLWFTCNCPASNKCACGNTWVNGNFCKKV